MCYIAYSRPHVKVKVVAIGLTPSWEDLSCYRADRFSLRAGQESFISACTDPTECDRNHRFSTVVVWREQISQTIATQRHSLGVIEQIGKATPKKMLGLCIFFLTMIIHVLYSIVGLY